MVEGSHDWYMVRAVADRQTRPQKEGADTITGSRHSPIRRRADRDISNISNHSSHAIVLLTPPF